ncbi:MAG: hypothetical protein AAFO76_11060 [Cyanobacteria bacterium J06607_15]
MKKPSRQNKRLILIGIAFCSLLLFLGASLLLQEQDAIYLANQEVSMTILLIAQSP